MRTLRQQQAAQERERNRAHDARQAGITLITLAHFPNGRDNLRRCYDCWTLLTPGEGCMQQRGTGTLARKKLVCRDRAACEARRPKATARAREEM
ncbi:MAG TPA: hypothetical protein VF116_23470 [Ktedonobacterales bacterium]